MNANIPSEGQRTVDSAAPLPLRPTSASRTPPPASGAVPPDTKWHKVEVTSVDPYGEMVKRTTEGDGVFVAAGLRALADQLDPPKPPRPGLRDVARDVGSQVRRSPGGVVVLPQSSDVPRNNPMSLQ